MTTIKKAYASATDEVIRTLEILVSGADPIRVCTGFVNRLLTLEDETEAEFIAGPLSIKRPSKSASGQQTLYLSIANVTSQGQEAIEAALESGEEVPVIYREYLASDLSAPATNPYRMTLRAGGFQGIMIQIEAGYFDLLNTQWPRRRYTADEFPGLRYI
ncbi:DUF1833 family protein [Marinobacter shengliensis]|uniref:DUF1833 family protein n=1 Tax=Marinobacter shengliensis TaxID=1389223 RepID=UPI001107D9E0|nr:DUF1833 family protein [Marinobacter shengliensis]